MISPLKGFFPTPQALIDKMLAGINFMYVDSILEPSAGKGDLADELSRRMKISHTRSLYAQDEYQADIDCIEMNPDLQHVLKGKGYRVIHDDFLTFSTYKRYSLIVMNPPFADGDKHLLKALDLMQRGGAIVCLLNAETLRDPFPVSFARVKLLNLLKGYDADITYLPDEFRKAERKTDVEIALVKVVIPYAEEESLILDALDKAMPEKEYNPEATALSENDYIKSAVDQFNYETSAGIQLIRDYKAMKPYISRELGGNAILKLSFNDYRCTDDANENEFLRRMRKKYWHRLFLNPGFTEKFTSNLLDKCRADVDRLADYDFSEFNINTIRLELSNGLIAATEVTIVNLFDELTDKHSWYDETSRNRHYFDGWYSNKCWIINKKVILPMQLYGYLVKDMTFYDYKAREKIADIDKTLRYLAWDKVEHRDVMQVLDEAREQGQTKDIRFEYFTLTAYKKGTVHITFTDAELLKKFNLFGCQRKKWLPPTYGRKRYAEMNEEEKKVIDSYEGEESYAATLQNQKYLLGGIQQLQLQGGMEA